ncbi:hypothetical protein SC984_03100, partial [Legionella pneumophila serogroup 1]
LAEKIWIINESVSYFNEFRPLDCFVATLLATTVPKIVPYREKYHNFIYLHDKWLERLLLGLCNIMNAIKKTG